jgi:hypothetical protein
MRDAFTPASLRKVPVSRRLILGVALALLSCAGEPAAPDGPEDGGGPPGPTSLAPDPTSLPVANGQAPDTTSYRALAVANQPAGFSYSDPVTGVTVWKVTSSSVPAPNTGAGHDYADGGNRATLGWGPDNDTHTILIRGDGMAYHLVDFTRGQGFTSYRALPADAQPDRDLCFSFSSLAGQPRVAYVVRGGVLHRVNTETMQIENTGNFPRDVNAIGWLQHDKDDVWFVGLVDATTVFAWNSQTDQYLTHSEDWLDEGRTRCGTAARSS